MIFEHEIPNGSRLYFGKVAKKKRELENKLSSFFYDIGFEEIVTPNFSYSGHQAIDDETKLIKMHDEKNNQVALRADSTLDVARIINKRLGRTTSHKKWFYIQPVFTYPANENYQIGCEWLEHENISDILNLTGEVLKQIDIKPTIQVTNINIAKLVACELNIDLGLFKDGEIAKLFELKVDWLDKLIHSITKEDLQNILPELPANIKVEVEKLIKSVDGVEYENIVLSPLYYTHMKYYTDVYYRVIEGNYTIAKGGRYESNGLQSLGFSLYTDNLLKILEK
jgi:ATP phosphoribosyltransferase regulatory subunit HisZ